MRLSLKRGLVVEASMATALSRVLSLKSIRRMRLRSLENSRTCSLVTEQRACVMAVSQALSPPRDSVQTNITVESSCTEQ
jgi:hypothetical protein